jgi:GTPase SAR1 family protein
LERIKQWLSEVKQYARSEATYLIFGNKRDLEEEGERAISLIDAAKFAQESECLFVEGSAKTGENVEEAF